MSKHDEIISRKTIYIKQFLSLLHHKWLVFYIGLKMGRIPIWRLLIHDWSKFTPAEFSRYAKYKYGDGGRDEWALGWLHHLHQEAHHPEHWIILWHGSLDFYSSIGGEDIAPYVSILPMSETYVREMIADMHGTSKQVTGRWDISRWLNANGPKIHFHDETVVLVGKIMKELGYTLTDREWTWITAPQFLE